MYQEFDEAQKIHINRDDKGIARELLHMDGHAVSSARTAQLAAAEYLAKFGGLLGVTDGETDNIALSPQAEMIDSAGELRFKTEKHNFDMTTVMYQQTHFGLPVWHGGVAIHMKEKPFRIVSSQSTRHADLEVTRPEQSALDKLKLLDAATLSRQLGLSNQDRNFDVATLAIERIKLIIYRFEAKKRVRGAPPPGGGGPLQFAHPMPQLPPVAAGLEENRHYVSAEIHFQLAPHGQIPLHWIAIIEANTLSVLYLRVFADSTQGQVFQVDPITTNGGPPPTASAASLNMVRSSVTLQGLVAGTSQSLTGNIVKLLDVEPPAVTPPTEPLGTDFNFNSRTNDFAAVNAYYHCDGFFRELQDLGFGLGSFFGTGTAFPSTVDHRGLGGNVVNAHCVGTSGGIGILQTTFALADTADIVNPIGIACDYRVVLHELGGHGVLYPHVHSANFGFSHSAGDSVAAITCDPDSHAPDRFVTFPWVDIGRRHDRSPAAGWGWSGDIALHPFDDILDDGGYNNEQILSTTLFRFYRSIGGDSAQLAMRQFASRFAVYLIFRAISTLTPATNPSNAAGFATALMNADLGDWVSESQLGGAYGKVIRWAFEKQGLYQTAGTPTPNSNAGAPPPVDVYIDDGRQGEYQYQPNYWSCQNIWNRRHNDGGTVHEEPIVGTTNYAYVKIKNRGTQAATGVVVEAFHAVPSVGLVYPNDWQPMTTAQLSGANISANNAAEVTVGPFQWIPMSIGHECMLMVVSATGDTSNINNMTTGNSIPEWRLVPNDNNIGQRNVTPVDGSGTEGLIASLNGTKVLVKNPHNASARVTIDSKLPDLLSSKGWSISFDNPGAAAFELKPRETKTVIVKLNPGKDFTAEDVQKAEDRAIDIVAFANGILVGGTSYILDQPLEAPPIGARVAKTPADFGAPAKKNPQRRKTSQ